uniref:Uncharacterized protein n=1 Tax=Romanomermis culicivorax TaxID=13658 RepID=A0A915HY18_ROMCU
MGSLFFFWRSVPNWVPRSVYIPAQSLAPLKEMTMVWCPSTKENNAVQSSRVAVNVSKMNIVPFGKYGEGSSAAEEVDGIVMLKNFESGWKVRLFRAEARNRNKNKSLKGEEIVNANNNLLTIYILVVHPEILDNGEAFGLSCTISGLGVSEHASVVSDNPLIVAVLLVQNCSNGGPTGVRLYHKLGFAVIHRIVEERG